MGNGRGGRWGDLSREAAPQPSGAQLCRDRDRAVAPLDSSARPGVGRVPRLGQQPEHLLNSEGARELRRSYKPRCQPHPRVNTQALACGLGSPSIPRTPTSPRLPPPVPCKHRPNSTSGNSIPPAPHAPRSRPCARCCPPHPPKSQDNPRRDGKLRLGLRNSGLALLSTAPQGLSAAPALSFWKALLLWKQALPTCLVPNPPGDPCPPEALPGGRPAA